MFARGRRERQDGKSKQLKRFIMRGKIDVDEFPVFKDALHSFERF